MTTRNETQTKTSLDPKEKKMQKESHAPALKAKKSNSRALSIVILLLALILIGLVIYTSLQLRLQTQQQVSTLVSQVNALEEQQVNTSSELDMMAKAVIKAQDKLQTNVTALHKDIQSALQQQQYQTKDWLLLKARYYLELAQINHQWSDDSLATVALLEQTDNVLANFADAEALALRKMLAKEISNLNATPKLDLVGILSQLSAAQDEVTDLSLKPTIISSNEAPTPSPNPPTTAWRQHLQHSIAFLRTLVVVHHHDDNLLPFPTLAYESMLREGLRLNLQEAQWAVLQKNEAVYQFSLSQALKNINRSFDTKAPSVSALIEQLQVLQQAQLIIHKSSLSESLPLLNHFIELREAKTPMLKGDIE